MFKKIVLYFIGSTFICFVLVHVPYVQDKAITYFIPNDITVVKKNRFFILPFFLDLESLSISKDSVEIVEIKDLKLSWNGFWKNLGLAIHADSIKIWLPPNKTKTSSNSNKNPPSILGFINYVDIGYFEVIKDEKTLFQYKIHFIKQKDIILEADSLIRSFFPEKISVKGDFSTGKYALDHFLYKVQGNYCLENNILHTDSLVKTPSKQTVHIKKSFDIFDFSHIDIPLVEIHTPQFKWSGHGKIDFEEEKKIVLTNKESSFTVNFFKGKFFGEFSHKSYPKLVYRGSIKDNILHVDANAPKNNLNIIYNLKTNAGSINAELEDTYIKPWFPITFNRLILRTKVHQKQFTYDGFVDNVTYENIHSPKINIHGILENGIGNINLATHTIYFKNKGIHNCDLSLALHQHVEGTFKSDLINLHGIMKNKEVFIDSADFSFNNEKFRLAQKAKIFPIIDNLYINSEKTTLKAHGLDYKNRHIKYFSIDNFYFERKYKVSAEIVDNKGSIFIDMPNNIQVKNLVNLDHDTLLVQSLVMLNKIKIASSQGKIDLKGNIDLETKGEIPIEKFIKDQAKGNLNLHIRTVGTVNKPQLSGKIKLANGSYYNEKIGLAFENIKLDAEGDLEKLVIKSLYCDDQLEGSLQGKGQYNFAHKTGNVVIQCKNFKPLHNDALGFRLNGAIEMDQKQVIKGNLNVDCFKLSLAHFKDRYKKINISDPRKQKKSPVKFNWIKECQVNINLTKPAFVEHEFLQSEWDGKAKATVIDGEWRLIGQFKAKEGGKLSFFGKKLDLDSGRVVFNEKQKEPRVDLVFKKEIHNRRINLQIKGRTNNVRMDIYSIPSMGFGDSMSYLLFENTQENLSPFQAGRLVYVIALFNSGQIKAAEIFHYVDMRKEKDGKETWILKKELGEKTKIALEGNPTENSIGLTADHQLTKRLKIDVNGGYRNDPDANERGIYLKPNLKYRFYY